MKDDLDQFMPYRTALLVEGGLYFSLRASTGYYIGGEPYKILLNGEIIAEGIIPCHELESWSTTIKFKIDKRKKNKVVIQIFSGHGVMR